MNVTEFNAHTNDFKDQIHHMVKEMFESNGGINPVVFALCKPEKEGEQLVVTVLEGMAPLFNSDINKEIAAGLIRKTMTKLKPLAIAFVTEAWVIVANKDELSNEEFEKMKSGGIKPSEHPDRKEVLFITTETHNRENIMSWDITEENDKRVLSKEPFSSEMGNWSEKKMTGKLTNFLKESYVDLVNNVELN